MMNMRVALDNHQFADFDSAGLANTPEIVSLEEAEAEESSDDDEDIPDVDGVEDAEDIGEDDADVFLEEDDDDDDEIFKVVDGDEA